jgi:hypothetical protein
MNQAAPRNGLNNRDWLYLGLVLMLILTIAFLLPVDPNDYWWYVRIGQDTLQTGAVPTVDTLSYTQAGQPVIYHSWLSALLFARLNTWAGIPLTVFVRGLFLALGYAIIFIASRQAGAGTKTASLVLLLAALASSNNWVVRPQMFAYFLFAAVLWILARWQRGAKNEVWILPFISLLWVNLHGSFVMLFLLAGAALLFGRGNRPQLAASLAITFLATLLNPRLLGAWQYVIISLTSASSQQFSLEWSPPLNTGWQMNLFFGWLLLFIPLATLSPRKLSGLEWAWLLGFGWLALSGERYVIWFIFLLTPLTARLLADWGFKWVDKPGPSAWPALDISLGILFCLLPLALLPGIRASWWAKSPEPLANTPVLAAQWLAHNPDIPGPLWSEIGFSSYLEYALTSRPVWIDTRFEVYPAEQWERYQAINKAEWDWQSNLDQENINLLMVSKINQTRLLEALQDSPAWEQIYQDPVAVLFQRGAGH